MWVAKCFGLGERVELDSQFFLLEIVVAPLLYKDVGELNFARVTFLTKQIQCIAHSEKRILAAPFCGDAALEGQQTSPVRRSKARWLDKGFLLGGDFGPHLPIRLPLSHPGAMRTQHKNSFSRLG